MLELAVLGLLHEAPMHGYELRKRLQEIRAFSCGTVYPTLRRMRRSGLIEETQDEQDARRSRRARRVYRLTERGRDRFVELVEDCGPRACQDEAFDVRLAFFARTPAPIRMRILESRRRRVEQRREGQRAILARADEQCDRYTAQLHRLGLDHSELEVRWLDELIAHERAEQGAGRPETAGDRLARGLDRDTTNGT
ncbi:PadR family transcriptional regulator [Actinopolyspora erythraea]|uniref:PadR family transcriptional regulator n=2 Tax=Actinopolyspora TaxID=1849 RepID=A0A099DAC3_9ACTN|nr:MULTISPECIES: PadR family transcriptional regulator [Actinopolyspora]ASU80473.1 PadR family transcriptional regulator [Actinopolyspora erythraea]KGI82856.1 PadR family transcriptional regulator [Actinopolyspora erythraea]SDP80366.1 DNA-binding transcriptional regulator, PadR family [Actinopolyspora xinjiangensis]